MNTSPLSPSPAVVSIVAKSNTGKTTLIEKLVPELRDRGLSVGVVKHHSHLSSFDVPGKDTFRMAKAGADVVLGISPVQVAVFHAQADPNAFEDAILTHCSEVDLVLTEGYKRGPFPKIEVHRTARSDELICEPGELLALVSDREWDLPVRRFSLDDAPAIADFLAAWSIRSADSSVS
jgi:molybdopterin-guanine dinucleotide biosynthesis protein MobB